MHAHNWDRGFRARVRWTLALVACFFTTLAISSRAEAQRQIPVNIESVPPGATVFVDSTEGAGVGVTPIVAARLTAGSHTLIFRLSNFEEARLTVNVARRRETFRAVLRPLGSIEVSAASDTARGGQVDVDGHQVAGGVLVGATAIRIDNLPPGRHQVRVTREGYNLFEQWVDVAGGQVVRVPVILERNAPTTGSILVTADMEGAPIFLDGRATNMTTTAVLDEVAAGNHTIEIRAEGVAPFQQTVVVEAGRRAEVRARIRPAQVAATTGSIAVLVDQTGALVRINGQSLPPGTYSREGLPPGNYVIQVLLEGFEPFRQEVNVTAGQTSTVDVQLGRRAGPPGPINVTVNVAGAQVVVDDQTRTAPFVAQQPAGGTHSVRVTAAGYTEQSFTCTNTEGSQDCVRAVELVPLQVGFSVALAEPIRVPAAVYVDDQQIGPVPYEGRLSIGNHIIEVRATGFETYTRQVNVEHGEGNIAITANMIDSGEIAAAAATSHSAIPIPIGHPMIDLSVGYPYFGELRLGIGVHELVDVGFTFRSFGRINEFEGRARIGTRVLREIAVGGQVRFGGGIGPEWSVRNPNYPPTMSGQTPTCGGMGGTPANPASMPRNGMPDCPDQNTEPNAALMGGVQRNQSINNAWFSLEGNLSLLFEPVAVVTLWLGLDLTSDQYPGHPQNSSYYLTYGPSGDPVCYETTSGSSTTFTCGRQDMARLRFGGAVEVAFSRQWNGWAIFEGVLAQSPDTRRLYSDILGINGDLRIYPRLGITYKF